MRILQGIHCQQCSSLAVDGLTPPRLAVVLPRLGHAQDAQSQLQRQGESRRCKCVCGRATAGVMALALGKATGSGRMLAAACLALGLAEAALALTRRLSVTALRDMGTDRTWIAGGRQDAQAWKWTWKIQ